MFVKVCDVASFTISTVDDPRTLNKVLYLRPPGNVYSMMELVEIWEMKIGKKLEKVYIPAEEVLKIIQGMYSANVKNFWSIQPNYSLQLEGYLDPRIDTSWIARSVADILSWFINTELALSEWVAKNSTWMSKSYKKIERLRYNRKTVYTSKNQGLTIFHLQLVNLGTFK